MQIFKEKYFTEVVNSESHPYIRVIIFVIISADW